MNAPNAADAQEQRSFECACRELARRLVPPDQKARLRASQDYQHLISRLSTLLVLLGDGIEALQNTPSRSRVVALILAADFVWQAIRLFADRKGDDTAWLLREHPDDHQTSDAEVGDNLYARQKQIVEDATWLFDLHTALRHPSSVNSDLLQLLREPVDDNARKRLLSTACALRRILVNVSVKLDPTVRTG